MSMASHVDRGLPDVEYEFPNADSAPRAARQALSPIIGSGSFADDVKLVASELVTNVVRHTDNGGWVQAWDADPFRLEVHDSSPILPTDTSRRTERGRGLQIVDQISSDWGTRSTPTGKLVWAE